MTFLAPAAGLLAAALALPVLLIFYLLKLRRRPVRISSTLLWERATHDLQVNAPLRWLRPSWLLFIQLLALLAFLTALARPALKGSGPDADRIVIVIDHSATMSATDGRDADGQAPAAALTRLDEAKRRADELVSQVRRSGSVAGRAEATVIAFAATSRSLTPFTSSPSALRDAIASVQPSDQPANRESLARVVAALDPSPGQEDVPAGQRTAVYIFSDGAFSASGSGGPPIRIPGSTGLEVSLVRVGPDPRAPSAATTTPDTASEAASTPADPGRDNLGVVALSAKRDFDNPAIARVFARVQNDRAQPVATTLQLRADGELAEVKPLTVPAAAPDASGHLQPGEAAATFELNRPGGGVILVSIPRPDLLASDNSAALILGEPRRPAILIVGPGGGPPRQGADPFLITVLQELDARRLLVVDPSTYESMAAKDPQLSPAAARRSAPASPSDDASFDLVIFDRVRPAAVPAIPSMSIGATLPVPGLGVAPFDTPEGADTPATRFLAWRRTHPLLRDVGLDPIIVSPPLHVTLPTAPSSTPPGSNSSGSDRAGAQPDLSTTILAQGAQGPLIVLLEQGPTRRLLIGFDLDRSNWGPDVSFPVFIDNAVEYLTLRGQTEAGRAFRTTDPITVSAAPGAKRLTITGPLSLSIDRPEDTPGPTPLGVLDRAGLYRVEGADPADSLLAVNLADPASSRIETIDWPTAPAATHAPISGEQQPADEPPRGVREIWPWFVLAGLALASIEWVLYARRMRA